MLNCSRLSSVFPAASLGTALLLMGGLLAAADEIPINAGSAQPPLAPSIAQQPTAIASSSLDAISDVPAPQPPWEAEKEATKLKWELRGRIHADAIMVDQSPKNIEDFGNFQNVVGFRRARIGAQGTVGENVDWVAEVDFAGGDVALKDMWIGINDLPIVRRIRVGNASVPFSLEGQTNSNYITFCERSPIMSLDPARKWGVYFLSYTEDERITLQAGIYRSGTNSTGNDSGDGNDMGYIARITALPWYEDDGRYLFMIGGAFVQQFAKDDKVTIGQGAQSSLLSGSDDPGSPFVPTITVPATQNQLYNAQSAVVLGPLSFQAEWSATSIDQIGGGPVFLHGFYAYASLFLTGENRNFVKKDGAFGMTQVQSPFLCPIEKNFCGRGCGAWELAVRFAYVNFNNSNLPLNDGLKVGTNDAETTVGLNWYLNDYTRIMFNWVHAVPVDPNPGGGPSAANAFFIRTAIFW